MEEVYRNWSSDALILSLVKGLKKDYVGLKEVGQGGKREAAMNSGWYEKLRSCTCITSI